MLDNVESLQRVVKTPQWRRGAEVQIQYGVRDLLYPTHFLGERLLCFFFSLISWYASLLRAAE